LRKKMIHFQHSPDLSDDIPRVLQNKNETGVVDGWIQIFGLLACFDSRNLLPNDLVWF